MKLKINEALSNDEEIDKIIDKTPLYLVTGIQQ